MSSPKLLAAARREIHVITPPMVILMPIEHFMLVALLFIRYYSELR
jgi:hypothetical protein